MHRRYYFFKKIIFIEEYQKNFYLDIVIIF